MTKDEMYEAMQRDADNPAAYVHNPLAMTEDDAAVWVALTIEAVGNAATHTYVHFVGTEREERLAGIEEFQMITLMCHQAAEVISAKLMTREEQLWLVRRKLEKQMGEPVAQVEMVEKDGVSGFIIRLGADEIPDDLSGLDGGE